MDAHEIKALAREIYIGLVSPGYEAQQNARDARETLESEGIDADAALAAWREENDR